MRENGIININKPQGWTSQDVVAKLRGRLHTRRVGHTGTLDPMATGVLPICFGKATRIIEYFDDDFKTYEAELQLGIRTDTLDVTGEVLETRPVAVSEENIRGAIRTFDGWITQIPPKYSALKVNGRPLYKYAREGVDVDMSMKKRQIYIDDMEMLSVCLPENRISFRVRCSKGTYIRTICDDLGQQLGCGAMMTKLVRTESGCFRIDEALELEDVLSMSDEELNSKIIPMENALVHLGKIRLKSSASIPFYQNGREIAEPYFIIEKEPMVPEAFQETSRLSNFYRVTGSAGNFLGISRMENHVLYPEKVIR